MLSQDRPSLTVCIIATNKYQRFLQPLIKSIDDYFFVGNDVTIQIFTDEIMSYDSKRVNIKQTLIPSYTYPMATLLRYKIMLQWQYDTDYIFYIDADMRIVDYVDEEILNDIVCVKHPGFYWGRGSWETNKKSTAYCEGTTYYAGGFQGGKREKYIEVMQQLSDNIDADLREGIIAVWHDESHWNCYLHSHDKYVLDPDYCMPEATWKRMAWSIGHFKPKILALEK